MAGPGCHHTQTLTDLGRQLLGHVAMLLAAHHGLSGQVAGTDSVTAEINGIPIPISIAWTAQLPEKGIPRDTEQDPHPDLGC